MCNSDGGPRPASAIESGFPFRAVNRLAATETYNKHYYRPTNYQHKWWARRLGSVFRTLCLGALSGPDATAADLWSRYAESNDLGDQVVFDPFMGGGTTGQEATRLGAKFVGVDLNPVAWFVARMGLAPPPEGLSSQFERVLERSRGEVRPYYRTVCPDCGERCGAQFVLWVELDEGTDAPGAADPHRVYDSLVVDYDRGGDGAWVVCPGCHALSTVDDAAAATCGDCGTSFDATAEDVRVPVEDPGPVFNGGERPAYVPYAVKYDCEDCGQGFDAFDAFDAQRLVAARERYREVRADLPIPTQSIPEGGEKTRDLHNRNYERWTDLFTDRQLLALGTLLRHVTEIDDDRARRYLTLTFSATLEFNTMFCSYKGDDPSGPGAVRHVFSHHAYVHPGEPLENNPLGTRPRQSGTFRYLFQYRLQRALEFQEAPVERVLAADGTVDHKEPIDGESIGGAPADSVGDLLTSDRTHYLHCGDAADPPFLETLAGEVDAVVTDPPYYDSVQYAELADFFYVWLKQALESDFPEAFGADSVVSAAEAVGNRSREKSLEDYRRLLQEGFETGAEVAKEDAPFVFTFHHREPAAWGAVLEAVHGAGLRVVATYPVRGENRLSVHINGQRAVLLDSVVVCRLAGERDVGEWASVLARIRAESRDRLAAFRDSEDEDLSRLDASVVVRGACLSHVSAHSRVLDDGGEVSPREAMRRVESLVEALNDREF
ncbi:MAG: DNA methyltransferase [Haloferacaceae archaeon]